MARLLLILALLLPFGGAVRADPVPLLTVLRAIGETYEGRVLGVRVMSNEAGQLFYEVDLLSKRNDLIRFRYDIATGRFLEVEGDDLGRAARTPDRLEPPDAYPDR